MTPTPQKDERRVMETPGKSQSLHFEDDHPWLKYMVRCSMWPACIPVTGPRADEFRASMEKLATHHSANLKESK